MTHGMDARLEQLIESYGADPARWPAAERAAFSGDEMHGLAAAREIDHVLGLASAPQLPEDTVARLMARVAEPLSAEVLLFAPRPRQAAGIVRFAAAVPLAASLALGIYLGAAGSLDFMLPATLTNDVAATDALPDDLGGVGDAEAYAEENFT